MRALELLAIIFARRLDRTCGSIKTSIAFACMQSAQALEVQAAYLDLHRLTGMTSAISARKFARYPPTFSHHRHISALILSRSQAARMAHTNFHNCGSAHCLRLLLAQLVSLRPGSELAFRPARPTLQHLVHLPQENHNVLLFGNPDQPFFPSAWPVDEPRSRHV